jgi:flagellar protein FlaG
MKIGDAQTDVDVRAQLAAARKPVAAPAAAAAAAIAAQQAAAEASRQERAAPPVEIPKIESVTRQIDSYLRSMNKSLQFRVDQATGEMVVTIRDDETGEVIRQVPGEDALRIAQRIEDSLSAMLDEKA